MISRSASAAKQILAKIQPRTAVSWRLPRWDYRSKVWRQGGQIFNRRSIIRIGALSLAVGTVIIFVAQIAMPQVSLLRNALLLLGCVLGTLLFLLVTMALAARLDLRPRVSVRADRIRGHDGQRRFIIDATELRSAFIYRHHDGKVRLKLCYRRRDRARMIVVGVPPEVDLNALSNLLVAKPAIRHASSR